MSEQEAENIPGGTVSARYKPATEHDAIQVVLAFPDHIKIVSDWFASRGLALFPIPVSDDDLPTYGIAPSSSTPTTPTP